MMLMSVFCGGCDSWYCNENWSHAQVTYQGSYPNKDVYLERVLFFLKEGNKRHFGFDIVSELEKIIERRSTIQHRWNERKRNKILKELPENFNTSKRRI